MSKFVRIFTYENESLQIVDLCPPLPMTLHPRLLLKATKMQAKTQGISLEKSILMCFPNSERSRRVCQEAYESEAGEQDMTSTMSKGAAFLSPAKHCKTTALQALYRRVALPETFHVHFKL